MAQHAGREGVEQHLVRKGEGQEPDLLYIDLHLVHEVTSPQAFDGLRLAGRPVRRPDLTVATEDHNVPTLDVLAPIADPVSPHPGRDAAQELRRVRRAALPDGPRRAGHRARRRPAARAHPARPDDRLRRQPHLHARRVRRLAFGIGTTEVEHVLATQTLPLKRFKTMAITVDSSTAAAPRRHEQGRHPRDHRQDRHRRRPGLRAGVPRQRHREPLDGGPDDDLQHVDRGRRPGRHDRAGRDDLRLPAGPRPRAARAPTGTPPSRTGATLRTDDDAVFDAEVDIDADALTPFVTWGTNPGQGLPLGERRAGPRADRRRERARRRRAGAGLHGPDGRHAAARDPRRHRLRRLLHQRPDRGPAVGRRGPRSGRQGRRRRADAGRPRLDAGAGSRPRTRAWTRSSSTPAPSGARRAARCAWA